MDQTISKMKKSLCHMTMAAFLCAVPLSFIHADNPLPVVAPNQQKSTVKGKVVDEKGEPIIGVTIIEKNKTGFGTITDMDGNYELEAEPGSVLVFNYLGYKTVEVAASNASHVVLTEDALSLDEVIVTGYTSQRKADLTGSVAVVKMDQIRTNTSGNPMRALQGKIAGMSVTTSGSPRPDALKVRMRGEGTLNNNDPLYIIDGTPTTRSLGELSSLDIESIQVLKDASSASIYGSRAANGVIIITTKRGKKGTSVDFSASYTMVSKKKPYDLMNTEQRGIAQYWAIKNNNAADDPNEVGIAKLYQYQDRQDANGNFILDKVTWKEWLDDDMTMRSADTDWQDEILRMGQVQQYNVTLSTGNESGNALFALDYYGNKGTIRGSYMDRFSFRMNSDYSLLNGKVKIGENFTVSKWRRDTLIGEEYMGNAKQLMSIVPVHTEDGGWGGPVGGMSDRQNRVREINDNKDNYEDNVRLFGNAYISLELFKGLTFRSTLGVDMIGQWRRVMDLTYKNGFLSEDRNKLTESSQYDFNWNNSNILQYVFDVNKHNFDIMLGQETVDRTIRSHWGSRRVFAIENPDYMVLDAGEEEKDNGGTAEKRTMISWFGKINYNYDNRYLASVTLRRDASSVFGANNRWATFPAFSLGWSLKNEAFMEDILEPFSQFKLRYGWGQNGNSNIDDPYASYQKYQSLYDANDLWNWNWGTAYDFTGQGGSLPAGYRRSMRGNPDLKWETTSQHNMGIDFGFFNNRLYGSFDYYLKYTRDILMKPGTVATLGEGAERWLNGADIDNKGFEITLGYSDKIGNVGLDVTGVFSHNKQKIKHIPEDVISNFPGNHIDDIIIGRSRNSLYGYIADGLFQSQAEVDDHATQVGAAPGRIRYRDLNGDGKIDAEDRTWLGNENPNLEYGINVGLTWKNWDFGMFFNGVIGKSINVSGWKQWTDFYSVGGTVGENYGVRMLDAWTPTNTGSTIPALSVNNNNDEGRFSTYFIESGSYLKIRNIELGYTLPTQVAENMKIRRARFYLRADNVVTLKKTWGDNAFTGIDPETPGSVYPLPFSMTVGVNVTF